MRWVDLGTAHSIDTDAEVVRERVDDDVGTLLPTGGQVIRQDHGRARAIVDGPLVVRRGRTGSRGRLGGVMVEGDSAGQGPKRRVHVVPHTHWDREWYLPFQRFRIRLVDVLDRLLDDLDAMPAFSHFLLDGQMAAVDDYLEIRPEREAQLRRLVTAGRIAMGPWYTLPDEFLVSGETLVRNLQSGLARAGELGGAMRVGYLPDMFGHVAQMPQLLRLFGLEHAVVWRGVPSSCTERTAFRWSAPDGSSVRAEYLPTGYGNGAAVPDDAAALLSRVAAWEAEHRGRLGPDAPLLWMNGGDHQPHARHVPGVLAKAQDESGGRYDLRITSLAAHLACHAEVVPDDELPTWTGELRSSARTNLLMGVASTRVEVKQAAAHAERWLERIAEPLHATLLPADLWPTRLLDLAWREVVRNAAHDSICACSHDDVVLAVLHRYAEARHIAAGLTSRALKIHGAMLAGSGPVAVNTVARERSGLVTVTVPGDEPAPGEQLLHALPSRSLIHTVAAADAAVIVERELDLHPDVYEVEVADAPDGSLDVVLHADLRRAGRLAGTPVGHDLAERVAGTPDRRVRVHLEQPPARTVLRRVVRVPGFGWTGAVAASDRTATATTAADGTVTLDNEEASVTVDPRQGTFSLDGVHGLGRLVDGGDAGDTYNACPPAFDHEVDRPDHLSISVIEPGPLRAAVTIDATYRWPERVDDATGHRVGAVPVAVHTRVELRAGERFVRVSHTFDNHTEDHRLRAWFPFPHPAVTSRAECAFAVVQRGLTAEGGPTEVAMPTFPSRRFVQAGGLTVAHEGLVEYELVDVRDGAAHALALTLLRATRMLSRGPMATRPLPAGPEYVLRGAQSSGHHELRYAIAVGETDPYALADDAFTPLLVAVGASLGDRPDRGQGLAVTGTAQVSAVLRAPTGLVVRAFNPTTVPAPLGLPGRRGAVIDLTGAEIGGFAEEILLAPGRIVTVRLDESPRV